MKRIFILLTLLCLNASAFAQLPPVFDESFLKVAQANKLTRTYIAPQRVVWTYSGSDGQAVKNTEALLRAGNGQHMARVEYCTLTSAETEKAAILLDYGRELHGGLKLVMGSGIDRRPSLVRIRFGESVSETNSQTLNTEWKVAFSTDDHAKRDFILEIPRSGSKEIGDKGFRFVRIDLPENNRTVTIKEARAILRFRDIPYLGSFKCNDEKLNKIWLAAAYTVHLNMQEYLCDGVKRDRIVFLCDMQPEVMTVKNVFGNHQIVPQSVDYMAQTASTTSVGTYTPWFIIMHKEWYFHYGDLPFLQKHAEYIVALIDNIYDRIDEDGNDSFRANFLDCPFSSNKEGIVAGFRGLARWALKDAIELCKVLNKPESLKKCEQSIEKLKRKFMPPNGLKQVAALMAIAGIMDAQKACDEVISVGGVKDFFTFYGYYMLEAQAKADHQIALDIIRQYWGKMINLGATTFWEGFDLDWAQNNDVNGIDELPAAGKKDIHGDFGDYCYAGYRNSMCHRWSSGPASWLMEHVLGVQIVEPGCKIFRIKPFLGDLQWVEGTFPTLYGIIKILHRKLPGGTVNTKVDAPKQVKIIKS